MKTNKLGFLLLMLFSLALIVSCGDDDGPAPDDDHESEEEINKVVLTFTPDNGEDAVVATWLDADGAGVGSEPSIDEIELEEDVTYNLTVTLSNTLGSEEEDITSEVRTEGAEHQIFYGFTADIFSNPTGNGNIDKFDDPVNYTDEDANNLPIGLSTSWTTGEHTEEEGEFRLTLRHLEDNKTASSTAEDGGEDLDITFPIHIEEEGHDHGDEEEINKIELTFTPTAGGSAVTFAWFDTDGEGVGSPSIDDIVLSADTEYDMTITLTNTLGMEDENITTEVAEEDDEHQFFFEFPNDLFTNPAGDGNIDQFDDPLNYNDEDSEAQDGSGNPVGLSTKWTTGSAANPSDKFRLMLRHLADDKTANSTADDGGEDLDIEFSIEIQ